MAGILRRSRLPRRGASTKRWEAHRNRSRAAVIERAKGMCEAHLGPEAGTQWCHLFGRGNVVAEPLASNPVFTVWLCQGCHDRLDDRDNKHDSGFRWFWRWMGIAKAEAEFGVKVTPTTDPVGSAREIERVLKERDVL